MTSEKLLNSRFLLGMLIEQTTIVLSDSSVTCPLQVVKEGFEVGSIRWSNKMHCGCNECFQYVFIIWILIDFSIYTTT